jgi:hypothetical protein
MKTDRKRTLTLVLALAAACCGLGLASEARAQQVVYDSWAPASHVVDGYWAPTWHAVYDPSDPVVYELRYERVYQGTTWHWSPALGWHTHDHYLYVPRWVPRSYVYPQSSY